MKKVILVSGLMLFSLFFGAGNLIFPPMLGYTAQGNMWVGMTGFAITGILMPYITVIVIAYYDGGVEFIGNRVHPKFGFIFAVCIYLSIGALYGIPRAANVAYEIGAKSILPFHNTWTLVGFSLVFFIVVGLIALYPNRMVDNLGKVLTPALLLVIGALCIAAIIHPEGKVGEPHGKYAEAPLVSGILEGYYTMDLVAALAFSVVIVQSFKLAGISDSKKIVKNVILAGLISAVLLTIIYFSLAYLGITTSKPGFENGASILTYNSVRLFGAFGNILFGVIVILACLTTCIGLVNASSAFGMKNFPKISYKTYVLVFSLVGFLISTLGLNMILQIAVPLLTFIYPISIVLVLISLVAIVIPTHLKIAYILPTISTLIISVLEILNTFKLIKPLNHLYQALPLSEQGLAWLYPFLVLTIIGIIIDFMRNKNTVRSNQVDEQKA
ncbi:branched-chain amino acid transport system II carrier protein [Staphylococcus carnosus]|uniref:Branched-chain amino acid transport system carrier protein n=1 Tax=Staphylococcus carnosus TaxID=1281 RepID=A0AAJ0JNW6_STACA|nr:branched-chain amino acid transport system II carrier protein [Staphylococcus carnosus]KKB25015.1 branched-chain amino acid transporter II carrier protein [Staphylococcus carnosus]POA07864.1 branched-chain amino acid transport system II carrier protein [Staphylococcus carnosus]QQS85901.1 branched-chain amino acid transport system II carrier protein [Staphylococcus carnosus]QRQ05836.1 branched-chain amino acid transport system II carrier protein [Staphylococcus carnosus]UTB82170.1 branched-c